MHLKLLSLFCLVIFCYQCSTPTPPKCKFGDPEAIFPKSLDKIKDHHFETKGQAAFEKIVFENGLNLEVIQSGCNDITQVFQFILPGDYSKEPLETYKELAIQNFGYLSTVSEKHMSLHHLSNSIRDQYHEIKMGESVQLAEGYFLKLDKVLSPDQAILIVELASHP